MALLSSAVPAQSHHASLIQGRIDESRSVAVRGNVRPEVTAANDRGVREAGAAMTGVLVLHRSADNEAAFESYVAALHDPQSASFHKWLSNAEIGTMFGPSTEDLARVSAWLAEKGVCGASGVAGWVDDAV